LSPGRDYLAVIYADDSKTSTRAHVRISQIRANSKTVLKMNLAPSGGEAIYLKPIN
jgi:alpha-glucosidase